MRPSRRVRELLDSVSTNDEETTISGMGDSGFGGRWCLERLLPAEYDRFFRQLQALITKPGAFMPAINERAKGWARLAFDFDCEPLPFLDHDAERRRTIEFTQLARLFVQELEMHFTGYDYASCVVARSDKYRFRLLFPGVCYVSSDTVGLLVRMVRRKCYGTPLYAHMCDKDPGKVFDFAPTLAMALRVHGTCKDGMRSKQYRVVATVCDSDGRAPDTDRLSVRPSDEDYERLFESPHTAFLHACSKFARDTITGHIRPHNHYWRYSVLSTMWNMEPHDSESDSETLDDDGHAVLLLSKRLLVVEYRGERCALLLHGERADTATLVYMHGEVRLVSGLNEHQVPDDELLDSDLLEGALIGMFTEHLRPPRVRSLLQFPLELFAYSKGYCPLQTHFNEETERYEFEYPVCEERRIKFEFDSGRMAELALAAIGKQRPAEFELSSETNVVRDRTKRYCNEAFRIPRYEVGTLVLEIEADCGSGKTVFALEYIERAMRLVPSATLLVVAPRAQLCSQLCTKVQSIVKLDVHNYQNGPWPDGDDAPRCCVVTLDSLVKTVAPNGVGPHKPTIVLLDEVELSAQHLASSATFSNTVDGRLRTLQTLMIIMANSRRVLAMDAHFGFGASLFLSMVAVKKAELMPASSMHYLHLTLEHRQSVQYTLLQDEVRRVDLIRLDLIAGKNVIVFEPTPRVAMALQSTFQEWSTLLIHGHSPSEMKEEFARDPNAYLHRHAIRLLIHTTSIGVGISIDNERVLQPAGGTAHYFDSSYVAYRPFLPDTAIVQGCFRARDLGHGATRNINFLFDRQMRCNFHRMLSMPTVGDALAEFETVLLENRDMFKRYSDLVMVSGINGRITVDYRDINTIFVACMLRSGEFAVAVQAITCKTRLYDESIELVHEGVASDASAVRDFKRCIKGVTVDASIKATDGPRTLSQKERLLGEIGYGLKCGKESPAFMGRLEYGMSHPSNIRRMTALLVLLTCDSRELRKHVVGVLDNVTESTPLYQANDARGITVGYEAVLAAAALKALGFNTADMLANPSTRVEPNTEVEVETPDGTMAQFDTWFSTALGMVRGERWTACKRSKSLSVRAAQFVNCFCGGKLYGVRSGVLDGQQVRLSAELVPGYLMTNGLEVPQRLLEFCNRFSGTWEAYIENEKRNVVQRPVY